MSGSINLQQTENQCVAVIIKFLLILLSVYSCGTEPAPERPPENLGNLVVDAPREIGVKLTPIFSYGEIETPLSNEIQIQSKVTKVQGPADYVVTAESDNWTQKYPVHIQGSNDSLRIRVIPPPANIPQDMAFIPPGEFRMGAKVPFLDADGAEPARDVHVEGFVIDRTEVSNSAFKRFIDSGGYANPDFWSKKGWEFVKNLKIKRPRFWDSEHFNKSTYPVVGVNWYEADAFCRFQKKRLPNEAEWEKAARGPEGFRWSSGNEINLSKGLINSVGNSDGYHKTAPVNGFQPNSYGLFNMSGNVWEWVSTEYGRGGLTLSWHRVLRGGSWGSFPDQLRAAYRGVDDPGIWSDSYGFRCARSL